MRNQSSWLGSSTGSSDFNNCYPRKVSKHKEFDGMVAMGSRTFNFLAEKRKFNCEIKWQVKRKIVIINLQKLLPTATQQTETVDL